MNSSPTERFRLDGQVAVVTGASSGIGRHCSLLLANAGAKVALASRNIKELELLAKEIVSAGGHAKAFHLDVTQQSSVTQCFTQITSWAQPTIVINNAGVSVTKSLLEQTEADWDRVVDTNLKGVWLVATEAARTMVATKTAGSIIIWHPFLGNAKLMGLPHMPSQKRGLSK